ncbi:hypothetical protein HNQ51_003414 [Inhella inkyongensis]|uniref:GAF domain-containing protein n=1 Tax=Inhella inkyongensis TaxID=392593 RepID=A0A840SC91_9BURK|nr:GAF domain-containing protein [Inhella inkyongensis]MBB5206071.1 hypothetical protein [Inhella inkyongensis]
MKRLLSGAGAIGAVSAILVLAGLAAWAAAVGLQAAEQRQALVDLSVQTQREADALLGRTLAGRAMGAMLLAGQMDGAVQSAARAPAALRAEAGARLSEALETLARSVEADAAWVLNEQGMVVGVWDIAAEGAGRKALGQTWRQQPHVLMAREQVESVYASRGEGGRELQLAAPIYAESGNYSAVQGVLLMRLPLAQMDRTLALAAELALLVSPAGEVFAASRPDLQGLRLAAVTDPLGPGWLRAEAELAWNDVQGPWRLLLLRQTPLHSPLSLGLVALVFVGVAALAFALWRAMRHEAARRAAVAQQAETAELLAQRARWQTEVASLGSKLQQSREVGALAQCFFEGLADLMPVHQASLYRSAPGQSLRLLAQWGGGQVPDQIELGQGLVGECAQSQQALWLEAPPPQYWTLRTGLYEGSARALVVLPVMRAGSLVAVLELAALHSELLAHRATLEALLPVLAVNLEAALEAAPRRGDA